MNVVLALCASGVAVDRFTNRLSIFNVIEQIQSPSFPAWVSEITFIVVLRKENSEEPRFPTRALVQAGDNVIMETAVVVNFEGGNTTRQILNFQGLPVRSPGDLTFRLLLPDREPATVTVPVFWTGGNVPAPAAPAAALSLPPLNP